MVGAVLPPEGPALLAWRVDPATLAVLLAAGSLYAGGVLRARRRGIGVRRGAAWAWFGGLGVLAVALLSPLDVYADVSFVVHMAQHVLLTLIVPPLLALGAPVALALRVARPGMARRLTAVLRSRPVAIVTSPVVAWVVFVGTPWVLHFTPIFDLALRSELWHALEHVVWVTAAFVLWWPVVGADPSPHPWSHPVRLLALFLAMPAMSFLSLAIFAASAPIAPTYGAAPSPWGPTALASQRDAAVLMWLASALILVPALLLAAVAWKRREEEGQRRLEARLDGAVG